MATDFPNYPATTFEQAVELAIFSSNQLHQVINSDGTSEVETENGNIPSVRKALIDNLYFKTPLPWQEGGKSVVFNQLYFLAKGGDSYYYYAPSATESNPIPMGSSPDNDDNWRLYSLFYKYEKEMTDSIKRLQKEVQNVLLILNNVANGIVYYLNVDTMLKSTPDHIQIASAHDTKNLWYWDGVKWSDLGVGLDLIITNQDNLNFFLNSLEGSFTDSNGNKKSTIKGLEDGISSILTNTVELGIYETVEDGMSNTGVGGYFRVYNGNKDNLSFYYYKNDAGTAKLIATTLGKLTEESVTEVLPQMHEDSALVALCVDEAGNVPLWLDNGRFESADVTEGFANKVIDKSGLTGIVEQAQVTSTLVPAFVDKAGNVPLWFENGELDAADVTGGFSNKVLDKAGIKNLTENEPVASTLVPLFVDTKGNVPLWLDEGMLAAGGVTQSFADLVGKKLGVVGSGSDWKLTDARSLYGFRLKKAKLIQGESVKLNVGFVGDSWSEYHRMPLNLYGRLVSDFGAAAGGGWLQFITDSLSNWLDMTVKTDGWTLYAARNTWTPSSHGCGVDGYANYTTTTTATMQVTNIKASNMNLYYFDEDGSFRYAIDGGTPVTVTGGNTKTVKKITITGISNSAQTLNIDTVGNTGTVSILGAYLSSSNKGIVVNKMGCGGTVSGQHLRILDQIPNFTPDLDLDLIILNLGVNDYLQNREPSEYSLNIGKIIDAYKAALPNVGFILVSPSQVNADSQYKMTDYRDAMKQVAKDKGVEWFGFYDDMPSDYSTGNVLGAYQDNYHLSDIGAEAYITSIYQNFIKQ